MQDNDRSTLRYRKGSRSHPGLRNVIETKWVQAYDSGCSEDLGHSLSAAKWLEAAWRLAVRNEGVTSALLATCRHRAPTSRSKLPSQGAGAPDGLDDSVRKVSDLSWGPGGRTPSSVKSGTRFGERVASRSASAAERRHRATAGLPSKISRQPLRSPDRGQSPLVAGHFEFSRKAVRRPPVETSLGLTKLQVKQERIVMRNLAGNAPSRRSTRHPQPVTFTSAGRSDQPATTKAGAST